MVAPNRARLSAEALWASTAARGEGSRRTRNGLRLVITAPPFVTGNDLVVMVRMYDATSGLELPIDPVRVFTHPPLWHLGKFDPLGAIWHELWFGVTNTPNPEGWVPA